MANYLDHASVIEFPTDCKYMYQISILLITKKFYF